MSNDSQGRFIAMGDGTWGLTKWQKQITNEMLLIPILPDGVVYWTACPKFIQGCRHTRRSQIELVSDQVLTITLTWGRHRFSVEYIRKLETSYILSLGYLLGSSLPFTDPKSCSGCLPIWEQLSLVA